MNVRPRVHARRCGARKSGVNTVSKGNSGGKRAHVFVSGPTDVCKVSARRNAGVRRARGRQETGLRETAVESVRALRRKS